MATKSRVPRLTDEVIDEVHMLQCRACRRFMGYSTRVSKTFCDDPLCLITREWVWDDAKDPQLGDLFLFLHEVHGVSGAQLAADFKMVRYTVNGMLSLGMGRTLRALM